MQKPETAATTLAAEGGEVSDPDQSSRQIDHAVPFPMLLRIVLISVGLFIAWISLRENGRAVWPLSGASPIFGLMIVVAWICAAAVIAVGLSGLSASWQVFPGSVEIVERSLFGKRNFQYGAGEVIGLAVEEINWSDGSPEWKVVISSRTGSKHASIRFDNRSGVERLKGEIEAVLHAGC
jgi:hypothetical protein